MQSDLQAIDAIIDLALAEDVGSGDATSQRLIPPTMQGHLSFVAREKFVVCGTHVATMVFERLGITVQTDSKIADGQHAKAGMRLLEVSGPARGILTGERVALNLLQRMCAVATVTSRYVDAVKGTKARILDTRKTMPGLRALDKYAVRTGGGHNHRMGLYDAILIKDNHIAICGGVAQAIAKAGKDIPVEIECDTLAQVREAIEAGATHILLDNMSPALLKEAVALVAGRARLEASGNVTLETVRAIAETGVDDISVGRLTHSVAAVDIGLDVSLQKI